MGTGFQLVYWSRKTRSGYGLTSTASRVGIRRRMEIGGNSSLGSCGSSHSAFSAEPDRRGKEYLEAMPIQGNREAEVLRGRLPTASRDFDQFVQHHVRLTSVLAGRLRLFVGLNTAA